MTFGALRLSNIIILSWLYYLFISGHINIIFMRLYHRRDILVIIYGRALDTIYGT